VITLFIIGNYSISQGNEDICKENKIYEKYSLEFNLKQTEQNQEHINKQDNKYIELDSRIKSIKNKVSGTIK